jgi:hypothetical protein
MLDLEVDSTLGMDDELDLDEMDDLKWDVFYSSFYPYEYVQGLYEIGSSIVGITVPEHLLPYVSQARQCYTFRQLIAVISLCKTILEVAVRDQSERKGHFKESGGNIIDFDSFIPRELIRQATSPGVLRDRIDDLYSETSKAIHGRTTIDRDTAKRTFRETMSAVHRLYS